MDDLLLQVAHQVPALVVLGVIVHVFLRELRIERTAVETIANAALDRNTQIISQNSEIIQRAVDSLDRNTESLGRVLATLDRLDDRFKGPDTVPRPEGE